MPVIRNLKSASRSRSSLNPSPSLERLLILIQHLTPFCGCPKPETCVGNKFHNFRVTVREQGQGRVLLGGCYLQCGYTITYQLHYSYIQCAATLTFLGQLSHLQCSYTFLWLLGSSQGWLLFTAIVKSGVILKFLAYVFITHCCSIQL